VINEDPAAVAYAEEHGIPPVTRPIFEDAQQLRASLQRRAEIKPMYGGITDKQIGFLNGLLSGMFGKDEGGTVARHQFLEYVFGVRSSKKLSMAQASVLIDWAKPALPHKGPHPTATREGWMVVKAWGEEYGQLELEI